MSHFPEKKISNGINGISATFRGGIEEPMHSWYPFLEGYSPGFVNSIINQYAPFSKKILDPFSGIGTTPLEATRMNIQSYYCEINPALQLLTEVKAQVLLMDKNDKIQIASELFKLSNDFNGALKEHKKDARLQETYDLTFRDSVFFPESNFDKILRSRSIIDEMSYENPISADFLLISTLASLVPSSNLIRAGDLRFRNKDSEFQKIMPFDYLVSNKLKIIANDLMKMNNTHHNKPILICEDARNIKNIKNLNIDAVITSPPYVNGTNYIRNSKLDLWFLRQLRKKADLKRLRIKAITTGINSVQKAKEYEELNYPILKNIISELKIKAYDVRIPKLIASYFYELNEVFSGLVNHINNNGILAIDIGDSIYAGIHIPTDQIFSIILENFGFIKEDEVFLRKRRSYNGSPLKQVLLIFRKTSKKSFKKRKKKYQWEDKWNKFKKLLPHQQHPFSKRNWGHPLHSLCSYQGKMKPSLAHHLVRIFLPKNGKMLDPFAGVGTIPFEAALLGNVSYGIEISPAALYISSAKIQKPDRIECKRIIESLRDFMIKSQISCEELSIAKNFGFNRKLPEYYDPMTFNEILLARKYFQKFPPSTASESLVMGAMLHILHGNRPYSLSRRSHPITPYAPTGLFEYRSVLERLTNKVNRSLSLVYPINYQEGKMYFQDATTWWPSEIEQLDAIITSPPFYGSTRFYMTNWLRLWFTGWERNDFIKQPKKFVDVKQKSSFNVYKSIFRQAREKLTEDGILVMHLGESKKMDMAKELMKVASPWFDVFDLFKENVEHTESHGIRDKGTVKKHQYLILK